MRRLACLALLCLAAPVTAQESGLDYLCGDTVVRAILQEEAATMQVEGETFALVRRPAANGSLFEATDDPATFFYGRGTDARVSIRGTQLPDCTLSAGTAAEPITTAEVEGAPWRVVRVGGAEVPSGVTVSLTFDEGRVSGSGGCNAYSGAYVLDGADIGIGPVAATRRGCPGAAGEVEAAFFALLSQVSTLARDPDGTLVLDGPAGRIAAVRE